MTTRSLDTPGPGADVGLADPQMSPDSPGTDVLLAKPRASIWKRLATNTSVIIGSILILLIAIMGVAAPLIVQDDPTAINPAGRNKAPGEEISYRDDDGTLTHFLWGEASGEHGPYEIYAMVHQDGAGLLELLGLLRSLGDQIHVVRIPEPSTLSMDDVLDRPHRHRQITRGAKHPSQVSGGPWWQARILDVAAVVGAHRWPGETLRCNVVLRDPLATHPEVEWDGVDGNWIVEFGESSSARRGSDQSLPTLHAGVGPFTRLLLGVGTASGLSLTTDIDGSASLLGDLDRVLRLPDPTPGMYF